MIVLCSYIAFKYFKTAVENDIAGTEDNLLETVGDRPLDELLSDMGDRPLKKFGDSITYEFLKLKKIIEKDFHILCAIISGLLLVVFFMLLFVQKHSTDVAKETEALELANEQNRSCVFDYDIKNRKIKFSGNYKPLFGDIKNPIDVVDFRKTYINIHEEDRSAMADLSDCVGKGDFKAEIRYKCPDGEYRWFRITGMTKKDREDNPFSFVGNFTDVNAQVLHENELIKIAETDLLSGLLNKSFYQKKVTDLFSTLPECSRGAFFIIDLDNFKATNDTLGHSMGDIAIRDAAQKIAMIFSQKDILGRIGGDEFCAYLRMDNVSEDVAAKIIMEKAASLNETLLEYYNNEKDAVQISASVGISLYPQHGSDFVTLFKCADAALYYVKRNGKNGNVIYTTKMSM